MAAGNIRGITIEIDGNTTPLQKALKEVDSSIKTTQSALRDVDKLLKLDPKNTELLAQKQKLLGDAISQTKDRLQQLKDAQGQVSQGTAEWDGLQREIIETEQKLTGLEEQYKTFGSVSAQQIKAAGQEMKELGGNITAAGQAFMPVSAAAGALVGGLGALGYKAVTAADDLNTLSKQTGISTDDLQKMEYASKLVDVSVDDIVGSMKKMKNNMDSNSKDVQEAWTRLGVSVRDATTGEMRPAIDVFYDTIAALSEVTNETERDQLAMDLFGKSADNLAGIVDDGGEAFKEYGQQAEELGLILSGETLDSLNNINDTIDQTKATLGASLIELGSTVATTFQPAIEKAAEAISTISQKLSEMDPATVQLITGIGLVVAAIGPLLIFIGNLITALGAIASAAPAIGAVLAALTGPIGLVIAAVAALIAIGVALYQNWDVIKQKCAEFAANVSERWNALKDYLTERINTTRDNIVNAWETIKTRVTQLVETLKSEVQQKWDELKQKVTEVVENIKNDMTEKWNNIKQTITDAITNAKETVTTMAGNIKEAITTNVDAAVQYLKDLPGKALQWGKDLINNFIDGIKDAWRSGIDFIKGIAEDVADFIGFSEPKKGPLSNFHTFAPDMMQLYAKGIKDNMYLVTDQMQALASNMAAASQRPANIYLTNNTVLNGRVIASAVNEELGFLL